MTDDFTDFLALLVRKGVEFLVVGGYAYVLHAQSRYTKDLDVWVRPSSENLERLRQATLEFAQVDFRIADVLALLETNRLGFPLMGLEPNKIEVLLRVKGLEFGKAFPRGIPVTIKDQVVLFIHPHDQIRNKRAAGRPRDLVDVADLVRLHGEPPVED
jgi:hypothetical protein